MRFVFSLFLVTITAAISSCDPCNHLECATDNDYGQFRVVSATTGNDLVFGANRVYDKNQIKFYSLKGTDTTFFDYQTIKFRGPAYDSILNVRFYPRTDVAYIRLSNTDIDTLNISYRTADTKCCGKITEITNFRYNNTIDIPGDKGTQEIKK